MEIKLTDINPFVRLAEVQPAMLESENLRVAFDNRLFFVLSGEGDFITEREKLKLSKGSLLFVRRGYPYTFLRKMSAIVINFDYTRICENEVKSRCPVPPKFYRSDEAFDDSVVPALSDFILLSGDAFIKDRLSEAVTLFNQKGELAAAGCSNAIKSVLLEILSRVLPSAGAEERLAQKLTNYVNQHASDADLSKTMAENFGYHPVYLSNVFKKHTGESLHKAIVLRRITFAENYLTQTELSVEQIALLVGFSSRGHFCTAFKAIKGVSPLTYRADFIKKLYDKPVR